MGYGKSGEETGASLGDRLREARAAKERAAKASAEERRAAAERHWRVLAETIHCRARHHLENSGQDAFVWKSERTVEADELDAVRAYLLGMCRVDGLHLAWRTYDLDLGFGELGQHLGDEIDCTAFRVSLYPCQYGDEHFWRAR